MYQKILAPLDGSPLAETALEHVKSVAKGCNVPEVILLYVVQYIIPTAVEDLSASLIAGEEARLEEWGKNYLDKAVSDLKKEGMKARGVVLKGNVASAILDYAEKNEVDLIIMTTHGRSGLARWVFGSVADRVSRLSKTPVLVVPPSGARKSR